ncbi:hypothetical protein RHGRI_037361 [Rhododendron griersonianum]|uniref:Pentatricopeptide repeat-containing protein n=1 Tax=Rhododendron griersonianum TaxID=479676 RepID=A0AAV6HX43_9ERIC|nr:hypothetical protein RHGRI_037361 [Rhododendron griersonianum]
MSFLSRLLHRTFSTSPSKTPPQPNTMESLSTALYKERNLRTLVDKFKSSSDNPRFRTKTAIYDSTVRRLASAKKFRWVKEILEHQKQYHHDISKEGFTARLISLYGKSGMFEQAHKVFDEMPDLKCDRTVKSVNALLGACVNSKKFHKVDMLFRELQEKLGVKPDVISYNTVIKAFCALGSFDSALSIVDEMEKKGVEPDLITFNTLLDGFYWKGRFVDGENIWRKMEKSNVVPDIRSYNAKLVGLVSEKKMIEAVELVGELGSKGVEPDVQSYNALIRGYCKDGNLEEVKRWYGEWEKYDCAPDRATFATLIPFLCEKDELDWAFELCKGVITRRRLVDGAVLQVVIDALVKESKIEEAKKLAEMGKSNNYTRYKVKVPSQD